MCLEILKNMEKTKAIGEIRYLMRKSGVIEDSIGRRLLEIVIICKLKDPSLKMRELREIAFNNSPMKLESQKECFLKMKEALQNLNTRKWEKTNSHKVVFVFVQNIITEIRIKSLIEMRIINEGTNLDSVGESVFCQVVIRQNMKKTHTFKEVITHIAKREGFEIKELVKVIYKLCFNKKRQSGTLEEQLVLLEEVVNNCIKELNTIIY